MEGLRKMKAIDKSTKLVVLLVWCGVWVAHQGSAQEFVPPPSSEVRPTRDRISESESRDYDSLHAEVEEQLKALRLDSRDDRATIWLSRKKPAELELALRSLRSRFPSFYRRVLERRLIAELAKTEPELALRYVSEFNSRSWKRVLEIEALRVWARANPQLAVEWFQRLPDGEHRMNILESLLPSLAVAAPELAIRIIDELGTHSKRNTFLSGLFWRWARHDPEVAFDALERLEDIHSGSPGNNLYRSVFIGWAEIDPEAAWTGIGRVPEGPWKHEAQRSVLGVIARTDVDQALDLAMALPPGSFRGETLKEIVGSWADTDFPPALDWALGLANVSDRSAAIMGLIEVWCEVDLPVAVEYVSKLNAGTYSHSMKLKVIENWSATDPQAAYQWVRNHFGEDLWALRILFRNWADADVAEALGAALNSLKGHEKTNIVKELIAKWLGTAPEAAVDWLEAHPDESSYIRQFSNLSYRMKDAAEWTLLERLVAALPEGALRTESLQNLARVRAAYDLPRALSWAESLVGATDQDAAIMVVFQTWAQVDPGSALERLRLFEDTERHAPLIAALLPTLGQAQPERTVEWAIKLPEKHRAQVMENVFESWARQYPKKAAEHVERLRADLDVTPIAHQIARVWARQDPKAALDWSERIFDEGTERLEAQNKALWHWASKDPGGALAWLREQPAVHARDETLRSIKLGFANPAAKVMELMDLAITEATKIEMLRYCYDWKRRVQPKNADSWLKELQVPNEFKERMPERRLPYY